MKDNTNMDTYGWDMVFACSSERVNALLQANASKLITSFSYSDGDIEMSGEFGTWQLVPGGSNKFIHFETPIQSGTLKVLDTTYDLSGVVPAMEFQLSFIDNVTVAGVKDLVFNVKVPGTGPGDATDGAVTTLVPDVGNRLKQIDPSGIVWGIVHDNLPRCFIANKEKLAYIFASINPLASGAASWLTAQRSAYVYIEPVSGVTGYLTILSVITDRDTSQLPLNVDTTLLTGNYDLFFLLSQEMFLRQLVMPGLPAVYGNGATPDSFVYANGAIQNNGQLGCNAVQAGLIWYYPHLDSLTIQVIGSALHTAAHGSFDITGLTDAYVDFTIGSTNACQFNPATVQISFAADPSPSQDYNKHIPVWEEVIALIGGPIILAIVDGVTEAVTSSVASSVTSSLNASGTLSVASAAPVSIQWQGLTAFTVLDAGLSGSFYMRGTYEAASPPRPRPQHW